MSGKSAVKIAVADDHPLYRLGVTKLLETEGDLSVVGEGANGQEALLLVEKFDPDVLLLDLQMPVMDGIEALSELAKRKARAKVILMLSNDDRDKAVRGVRLGARGILFKDQDPELIPKSIRKVHAGEVWADSQILSAALETLVRPTRSTGAADGGARDSRLSNREMEVVRCVAMGLRNKEVADKLGVSDATVKNHLTSIYGKLGVSDRLELILFAIHNKLIKV